MFVINTLSKLKSHVFGSTVIIVTTMHSVQFDLQFMYNMTTLHSFTWLYDFAIIAEWSLWPLTDQMQDSLFALSLTDILRVGFTKLWLSVKVDLTGRFDENLVICVFPTFIWPSTWHRFDRPSILSQIEFNSGQHSTHPQSAFHAALQ